MSGFDRSLLARLLQTVALSLILMTASAAEVHAQVIGADGSPGANGVNPGDSGQPGGDGESVSGSGTVIGGNGGAGGNAAPPDLSGFGGNGGNGGNGGAATATGADANAIGGNGGSGGSPATSFPFNGFGGNGGAGGSATAIATGSSESGDVSVSASAQGGAGGLEWAQAPTGGEPGAGGDANATADASAGGGGTATAGATATGGVGGDGGLGASGAANASSTATTSLAGVSVQSNAAASIAAGSSPFGGLTVTTLSIAQAGSGQPVPDNPFQSTSAFSTIFPDEAYTATVVGDASNVADAFLGPDDKVFGIAILESDGGDSSSTFDFTYHGDLLLGLVGEDSVINLGANVGSLTLDEPDVYVIGAVVPEPSTWAMMLVGFAGLTFAGYRRAKADDASRAPSMG